MTVDRLTASQALKTVAVLRDHFKSYPSRGRLVAIRGLGDQAWQQTSYVGVRSGYTAVRLIVRKGDRAFQIHANDSAWLDGGLTPGEAPLACGIRGTSPLGRFQASSPAQTVSVRRLRRAGRLLDVQAGLVAYRADAEEGCFDFPMAGTFASRAPERRRSMEGARPSMRSAQPQDVWSRIIASLNSGRRKALDQLPCHRPCEAIPDSAPRERSVHVHTAPLIGSG